MTSEDKFQHAQAEAKWVADMPLKKIKKKKKTGSKNAAR